MLETRAEGEGYVNRRRRRCSNGHVFSTYEVDDSLEKTVVRNALSPTRIGGRIASAMQFERDEEIRSRREKGEKIMVLSIEYGLSETQISIIARKGIRREKIVTDHARLAALLAPPRKEKEDDDK